MSFRTGEEGWRKGPWTSEEDRVLIQHVKLHGEGRWNSVSMLTGLKRNGKSCRLRWVNYLRPDLKRGQITPYEEKVIIELHAIWGNRWSTIARSLPGRTDNEIKNYWRTHFKKRGIPTLGNPQKAKARLLRRQNFQQQQQQLLLYEKQQNAQMAEMESISLLQEKYTTNFIKQDYENPKDYAISNNTTDDLGFLYSMINNHVTVPEAMIENTLWDGLWSFDHVNGSRCYSTATSSVNPLHNSATSSS